MKKSHLAGVALGMLCVACSHSRPESAQPSAALPPPPSATVQGVADGDPAPRTLAQMLAGKLSGVSVNAGQGGGRSEEHTSELQSHGLISYAVFCLKKK